MNFLLTLLATIVAVSFAALPTKIANHEAADVWKEWKHKFDKEYDTIAEEVNRFAIWAENLKKVR